MALKIRIKYKYRYRDRKPSQHVTVGLAWGSPQLYINMAIEWQWRGHWPLLPDDGFSASFLLCFFEGGDRTNRPTRFWKRERKKKKWGVKVRIEKRGGGRETERELEGGSDISYRDWEWDQEETLTISKEPFLQIFLVPFPGRKHSHRQNQKQPGKRHQHGARHHWIDDLQSQPNKQPIKLLLCALKAWIFLARQDPVFQHSVSEARERPENRIDQSHPPDNDRQSRPRHNETLEDRHCHRGHTWHPKCSRRRDAYDKYNKRYDPALGKKADEGGLGKSLRR